MDETSIPISSLFKNNKLFALSVAIKEESFKSKIQYSVSFDSFNAILNLEIKSVFY